MATEYIVFSKRDAANDSLWEPIGTVLARSAQSAIQQRLDGVAQGSEYRGEGTYAAVPARSWKPVTVKVETKTALKFS